MVVSAPGVPGDPGWWTGIGLPIVVVVKYNYHRLRAGNNETGILPLACLAVEVPHDPGIPAGEPAVQPAAVVDRARVGDAAGHEAELLRPALDGSRETHG
jgi:hypothetical protein